MKNKKNEPVVAADKENSGIITDTNITVSEDDIKKRAYELYLDRKGLYAPPEADWIQAEAELRNVTYKKKREENF
jgi:hypothetical protein